jgi:hypothetical protein
MKTNLLVAPQYEKVRHPLNAEGEPTRRTEWRDFRASWTQKIFIKEICPKSHFITPHDHLPKP